jgi:hypothetical protein
MIITPPTRILPFTGARVFLAGSIEMGKAEDWQKILCDRLDRPEVLICNPRRANWDSSWEQSINNPVFKEQVTWELDMLSSAHLKIFVFQPETKSPITLLELGVAGMQNHLNVQQRTLVYCPEGFWRKGNVEIVCERYGMAMVPTFQELITQSKSFLSNFKKEI